MERDALALQRILGDSFPTLPYSSRLALIAMMQHAHLRNRYDPTPTPALAPFDVDNLKAVADENVEPGITGPVIPDALEGIVSWLKKIFSTR